MDEENSDSKSPTSPPSSGPEVSMCPDYISSYTQISQFQNNDQNGDHTDIESSDDEFSDELQPDPGLKADSTALPELSSQIVEWSKKTFESIEGDPDDNKGNLSPQNDISTEGCKLKEKSPENHLQFFQMNFLLELENQAMIIAENLNKIMLHIGSFCSNATSSSVDIMKVYQDNVLDTCDTIDANIKLMYKIISKCEELNKSLKFLDELKNRIKDIKQTLDTFERIII